MKNSRSAGRPYHVSARLLARKGGAEPLLAKGNGLVLSRDAGGEETDEERLSDAIVDTTFNLLTRRPKGVTAPKAAASLTDLFDPALAGGKRRVKAGPGNT